MRPRYLTVAVAAVALGLLAAPAQAAMPTSKPTETKVCSNNPKKKLKIWATKSVFAVQNDCKDWFVMLHKPLGQGDYAIETISVAGYSKVSLPMDMRTQSWRWLMRQGPILCGEFGDRAYNDDDSEGLAYYGDGHQLRLGGSGMDCENTYG